MLPRRIIAVSPDKALSKVLSVALKAAGGVVDLHTTTEELGKEIAAALVVVHVPEGSDANTVIPPLVARLTGDTRTIAILHASNLETIVEVMQSSDRVAGMLLADNLDPRELSAMATRILGGDIFGLDKLIRWGTQIHSQLIGDYQEKSVCIAQISEFAETMGVRRKYREAIEQCIDEMLMNALYDAPVDEEGKQIFAEIPTKTRISLKVEQKVVVQYACDGKQFAVSVRDAFGTLERSTVLRYLYKCLHNPNQIDRKVGGAGLGLYLMTNSSSEVYFNVLPKVATEAVCVFDLETPKIQLEAFGFFNERIDAAGRLAAGPARKLPAGAGYPVDRRAPRPPPPAPGLGRGVVGLLVAMIVVVLALIGMVAYPRLTRDDARVTMTIHVDPPGASIDIDGKPAGTAADGVVTVKDLVPGRTYPVVAKFPGYDAKSTVMQPGKSGGDISIRLDAQAPTVRLDSTPTGATIEIDGKPAGTTPAAIRTLTPRAHVSVTFKKAGYHDATADVEVPGPGGDTRLVQPLLVSDDLARVKLVSEPPGAQVMQNGQLVAGVMTPAEVLVEAGKPVKFTLTMQGKVPTTIDLTPGRGETVEKTAKLVDGVTLTINSNLDGKVTIAPFCRNMVTPATCMLPPGNYSIDLAIGTAKFNHKVEVAKEMTHAFEFGYVTPPEGAKLQIAGGAKVAKQVLEVGPRDVTVVDAEGATRTAKVVVKAGNTVVAN